MSFFALLFLESIILFPKDSETETDASFFSLSYIQIIPKYTK